MATRIGLSFVYYFTTDNAAVQERLDKMLMRHGKYYKCYDSINPAPFTKI